MAVEGELTEFQADRVKMKGTLKEVLYGSHAADAGLAVVAWQLFCSIAGTCAPPVEGNSSASKPEPGGLVIGIFFLPPLYKEKV